MVLWTRDFWLTLLLLTLPLVVSGVLHMLVVRWNLLSALKIPLHEKGFGANKTWRGVVLMPLLTIPGVFLADWFGKLVELESFSTAHLWSLGLWLGLGYVIAELPNSYFKRRLGIPPGETAAEWPWLFSLIDQTDSTLGCLMVYAAHGIGTAQIYIALIFFGALVHIVVNLILWALGLRRQPL